MPPKMGNYCTVQCKERDCSYRENMDVVVRVEDIKARESDDLRFLVYNIKSLSKGFWFCLPPALYVSIIGLRDMCHEKTAAMKWTVNAFHRL